MAGNFITLGRDVRRLDFWKNAGAFSRRDAFVDLVMDAAYLPMTITTKTGKQQRVNKGQVFRSLPEFAWRWKWSEKKVRCFFKALEREGLIIVSRKGNDGQLITLLNYEQYQGQGQTQTLMTQGFAVHEGQTEGGCIPHDQMRQGQTQTLMTQGFAVYEGQTDTPKGQTEGQTEGQTQTLMTQGFEGHEGQTQGQTEGQTFYKKVSQKDIEKDTTLGGPMPPPTREEVKAFFEGKDPQDPDWGGRFFDHYQANGWRNNRGEYIASFWQFVAKTAIKNGYRYQPRGKKKTVPAQQYTQRHYEPGELERITGQDDLIEEARKYHNKTIEELMQGDEA